MATNRISAPIASATSAPTSETAVATLTPGGAPGGTDQVLIRADLVVTGAASVTAVTVNIRRGPTSGLTGAVVATTGALTVTGAQIIAPSLGFRDSAYDGTGYVLSVQAAGAAATCGPGQLECQVVVAAEAFGE